MVVCGVDIDIEKMDSSDMCVLIGELKRVYNRKLIACCRANTLHDLIEAMKDEGFSFCHHSTGELLKPEDYVIFDSKEMCVHCNEVKYEEEEEEE